MQARIDELLAHNTALHNRHVAGRFLITQKDATIDALAAALASAHNKLRATQIECSACGAPPETLCNEAGTTAPGAHDRRVAEWLSQQMPLALVSPAPPPVVPKFKVGDKVRYNAVGGSVGEVIAVDGARIHVRYVYGLNKLGSLIDALSASDEAQLSPTSEEDFQKVCTRPFGG